MFAKIDRYLARSFFEPFIVALVVITGLYIVADAFSNVEKYVHVAGGVFAGLERIAQIYLLRAPTFLVPVAPIAMLVGAAYGIAELSAHNEINAMKASGLSFWRILSPMYAVAVVAAFLAFANREMLVPVVERSVAPDLQTWIGKDERYEKIVVYVEKEETYFTLDYNLTKKRAKNFSIHKQTEDGKYDYLLAREAEPAKQGWMLHQVQTQKEPTEDLVWPTSLRVRDLDDRLLPLDVRPISAIERAISHASDPEEKRIFRFYYSERLTYPFSGIVLIALAVPFVLANERIQRNRMLGIGVCILISMSFYIVQYIARDLGLSGRLMPEIAAWLPIVLFGAIGFYMLERTHG